MKTSKLLLALFAAAGLRLAGAGRPRRSSRR